MINGERAAYLAPAFAEKVCSSIVFIISSNYLDCKIFPDTPRALSIAQTYGSKLRKLTSKNYLFRNLKNTIDHTLLVLP